MDYNTILKTLNQAQLFELYRLYAAIGNELDNPHRIAKTKQKIRLGMQTQFYSEQENRLIPVTVIELKPKRVVVRNQENQKQYAIPYYMINIEQSDIQIHTSKTKTLDRNQLHVGEIVGFTNEGRDVIGKIKRLNPKTVTLITADNHRWRVAYSFLFRITDSELSTASELPRQIKSIDRHSSD